MELEQLFSILLSPMPDIPLIAPHSPSTIIIWGWYNKPFNGLNNSELGSTPLQEK
jgi:hypothetical protein